MQAKEKAHPYQVIVIGGGPAGLMAAGQAAAQGVRTVLLEKMRQPGRKLRITGKGRCNLTNIASVADFITHFGKNGSFLRQAFARFFAPDLLKFFTEIGIQTVTERGGRVFPVNGDAQAVVDYLVHWAVSCGVEVRTSEPVKKLLVDANKLIGVHTRDGHSYYASDIILATGGASYPATGSTGDGYPMAAALGHTIVPIRPVLVPLKTSGGIAPRLQGLSLRNVSVTVWINSRKRTEVFGEMLFTHFGVSGPLILSLSGRIVEALQAGHKISISIDLKPALDEHKLDARLLREIDQHGKRHYQTMLKQLLPSKLIPVCIDLTGIPANKPCHQLTSQERKRLLHWLKDFRLEVSAHLPIEAAIVTAGGVSLQEVDPRTMRSKLIEGLYFAGEVLDLDADTGGYNLQAAFSTGWLAGRSVAEYLKVG
ncbi:MAG TPA: NAD(P)/FAD-dependent oxidoreductase [Anaerolineae bacterium]|nr:NAD(P)/FAD-dependent oxidoreductase [Anaerolineae bacterium]